MHDVACEFACAVGCAETISANVLKLILSLQIIIFWIPNNSTVLNIIPTSDYIII